MVTVKPFKFWGLSPLFKISNFRDLIGQVMDQGRGILVPENVQSAGFNSNKAGFAFKVIADAQRKVSRKGGVGQLILQSFDIDTFCISPHAKYGNIAAFVGIKHQLAVANGGDDGVFVY